MPSKKRASTPRKSTPQKGKSPTPTKRNTSSSSTKKRATSRGKSPGSKRGKSPGSKRGKSPTLTKRNTSSSSTRTKSDESLAPPTPSFTRESLEYFVLSKEVPVSTYDDNDPWLVAKQKELSEVVSCGCYRVSLTRFSPCRQYSKVSLLCSETRLSYSCTEWKKGALCLSRSRACCIDHRLSFPSTDEVPCEVGLCGLMCKKAEPTKKKLKGVPSDSLYFKTACCCNSSGLYLEKDCIGCESSGAFLCFENDTICSLSPLKTFVESHNQGLCCLDTKFAFPPTNDVPFRFGVADKKFCECEPLSKEATKVVALATVGICVASMVMTR
jgi:hypothetical protein